MGRVIRPSAPFTRRKKNKTQKNRRVMKKRANEEIENNVFIKWLVYFITHQK